MTPQPTADPNRRSWLRQWPAWAISLTAAGLLAYLGAADPHRSGSLFPPCPFRVLTGWYCPLCGGQRMVHDLLHADLRAAVQDNVVLVVGAVLLGAWLLMRRRRGPAVVSVPVAASTVLTLLVWTVVRNLPGFPLVPALITN